LSENLATENLGAADVAAIAAKYVLFDSFELEESDEIVKDRMHGLICQDNIGGVLRARATAVDKYTRATDEYCIIAGKE